MAVIDTDETIKIGGQVFFAGRVMIPDELVDNLDERLKAKVVHLPPGTKLRGIWYYDGDMRRRVKWVAYVE